MEYLDRVYRYLDGLEPGSRIDLTKLDEPEKFYSALDKLVQDGYITNLEYGISEDRKTFKKY